MRLDWAKVTLQSKVKRISKPSCDLTTFVSQVKTHFKELEGVPFRHEDQPAEGQKSFGIKWQSMSTLAESTLDKSVDAIEVTDKDQFSEIMRTHVIGKEKVPRFQVFILDAPV